jgi:hypothetical protein
MQLRRSDEKRLEKGRGCHGATTAFFSSLAAMALASGVAAGPAHRDTPLPAHEPSQSHAKAHDDAHEHSPGHHHGAPEHRLSAADFKGAPKDLVLWGQLAKVGVTRKSGRYHVKFLPPVLALEGKTVTLVGFMAPVHGGKREKQFLLSDTRFLCDTCQSAPALQSIVEVNALVGEPIRDRPIMVRGKLELVHDDPNGLIYRLRDARVLRRQRS